MEAVSATVCLSSAAQVMCIDVTRALFAVTQRLLPRELNARFGATAEVGWLLRSRSRIGWPKKRMPQVMAGAPEGAPAVMTLRSASGSSFT